jgi:starch-binding outer membrane protein, SusD/RagB family
MGEKLYQDGIRIKLITQISNFMKLNTCLPIFVLMGASLLPSCDNKEKDQEGKLITTDIKGAVQKGPFLNGSVVTVSELQDDLSQTGKTYTTEITDSKGSFNLQNISLISNYVEISASGYYFN